MKIPNILIIAFVASMLGACATTIPVGERESVRQELNDRTDETLALLLEKQPELQASLDTAVGYFVARLSGAQVAVIGGAVGMGVLYDKEAASRTYMNVTRYDLGLGAGAGAFRVVVLFQTRETLEQFRSGTWRSAAGAETAAGTAGAATPIALGEGSTVHAISESGAIVAATARLIRLTVNTDLTDVGVSEVSIPGRGFTAVDQQGDDAPRVWNRALPFLAQQVIDKGYELPLPYGIGLTYAHVDQEQILSDLEVGLNGGAKEPFPFVGFDNARSVSDSLQLKLDAWLFPFMNVFALFGRVDGEAPLNVYIDGNGMLDQLGVTCGPGPPNPLCGLLENQTFVLDIEAKFKGNTYGAGTVLAGGWNNWFVTVPISYTYADMEGKETEGATTSVTPRFGRVFNLGDHGNLALYTGGSYLRTKLTVQGTEVTPDGLLVIDYTIEQKNKDRWAVVLGGNWDINKRWSWSAEYNGFTGSRDAFITSVGRRF
jgi:lipid-binding SYLF domain-containing protein